MRLKWRAPCFREFGVFGEDEHWLFLCRLDRHTLQRGHRISGSGSVNRGGFAGTGAFMTLGEIAETLKLDIRFAPRRWIARWKAGT